MDKSTGRSNSQIFVTGFQNFELVYVPQDKQVVSVFQGLNKFTWNSEALGDNNARD